jgi:Protein kinase domain
MRAFQGTDGARRGWLSALVPRGREPVAPEFYRFTGKLRVGIIGFLLLMNLTSTLSLDRLGVDRAFWFRIQIPNTVALLTALVLGAVIARGSLGLAAMRRATYACVVAEMTSGLLSIWMVGSVTSHMILATVLVAAVYRAAFDFRTGTLAFAVLAGGWTVIVTGELTGLWRAQPASAEPVLDQVYRTPGRELTAAAMVAATLGLAFVITNWMVARLRHRERAIQILRESLAASEAGRLGRHTGRTLKDTYVVGGLIGAGGMGEVYRARHRRTRRPVAVKLLHAHLADDPVLLARFRREAEIAGTVGSDHIVSVIDVDVDDDQPFLVLELLEGETLRDRVERGGPLSLEAAADVLDQVGAGLDAAHGAGVVHRDLKPENIFLVPGDGGPRVKILDFGVSKIRGAATALTGEVSLLGTPDFMSPEQAMGQIDEVDARADVFAAGGVLYHALTGQRPFYGSSVPALLRCICDEAPIPLDKVRTDLGERAAPVAAVLAIAMAKPAAQRHASVGELAADLRLAVAGDLPAEVLARAARVERGRPTTRSVGDARVRGTDDTLAASAGSDETVDAGAIGAAGTDETVAQRGQE